MLPQTKRRGSNPFHLPSEISQQSNEYYMQELFNAIDTDLDLMRLTISSLGSSTDTIQSRRQFAMLQIEVNQKIMKATKDQIDLGLDEPYTLQIEQKTEALRSVVELAINEFARYPPKRAAKNAYYDQMGVDGRSELTPLLSNLSSSSPVSPYVDEEYIGSYNNEHKTEDAEWRETESVQSVRSLQNAFDALYAVIHEQELMMLDGERSHSLAASDGYRVQANGNANGHGVRVIRDSEEMEQIATISTSMNMQSARARQRRDQRNMIVGLILALITLSVIICYIYFRFIYRK